MSEMGILRKEDISLYYYIKDDVLSGFIETEIEVPLNYVSALSTPPDSYVYDASSRVVPRPNSKGRGWVYFDTVSGTSGYCERGYQTIEQSNRVKVYDTSGSIINESLYMVDYIDGRIITEGGVEPAYVTYDWYYVSVLDEWDGLYGSISPVVVIDIQGTRKNGFQLGGGKVNNRKCIIHIFASSAAERNDLSEIIYDGLYLKSCPLYELPHGTVLDFDGTFYGRKDNMNKDETLFDRTTVSNISNLKFDNIDARSVDVHALVVGDANEAQLSDLNRYRAKVTFNMFSYKEW